MVRGVCLYVFMFMYYVCMNYLCDLYFLLPARVPVLPRRRCVSKHWLVLPADAEFWHAISLQRFGVFDHEAVFETAASDTKGAVGFDLFSIRLQQSLLQDTDI